MPKEELKLDEFIPCMGPGCPHEGFVIDLCPQCGDKVVLCHYHADLCLHIRALRCRRHSSD